MQTFDYSTLIDDGATPVGAAPLEPIYHRGDGIQFRPQGCRRDILQETVRLNHEAFLLASDYVPEAKALDAHQQVIRDCDWIHFQFRISGGGFEKVASEHVLETPEKSCVVSRYPKGSIVEREVGRADRWKYVCLFVSPKAFGTLLDLQTSILPSSLSWLAEQGELDFQSRILPLTSGMTLALNDILTCTFRGLNRRTYMRAKSLELLADVTSSLDDSGLPGPTSKIRLSQRDFDRIASARAIMINNLDTSLTLAALARRVGLNRTKLALGFREMYGESVQAFWRDIRLVRARELLLGGKMAVTEVALSMGYSELSSFTRAFSRKFGLLPRECRRTRN